jgi:hypothetical protein
MKVISGYSPLALEGARPPPRRHSCADRFAKIYLGLPDLGFRCACALPLFPRKRDALDQVRNRLLRWQSCPFCRWRQQARSDQVNETQLDIRDA